MYVCVAVNGGLGCNLSKHAFDMQEIVAPVSNKNTAWLLILTGKLVAYLVSLSLTSIISCTEDSYSESEADSTVLSELATLVLCGILSVLLLCH